MVALAKPPNKKTRQATAYQAAFLRSLVKEIEQAEWSDFDFRGSGFYQAILADHLTLLSEERGITRRQVLDELNRA